MLMEEVAMDLGVSDMVAECWLYCVVFQFSMERLMAMVVLEELTRVLELLQAAIVAKRVDEMVYKEPAMKEED